MGSPFGVYENGIQKIIPYPRQNVKDRGNGGYLNRIQTEH